MRVLVVEDERNLADAIARGLRREGMAVDVAYDGDAGHERPSSPGTTWWCSTATCPACTATRSAPTWSPPAR